MLVSARLRCSAAASLALVVFAGPAAADCAAIAAVETFHETSAPPDEARCTTFLGQSGKDGVSCHWTFPFRDAGAAEFAASLWSTLAACRPGSAGGADQRVNHPDSFDLLEWQGADGVYRVSVKDKGGLNRTLVFLGFEGG